ncbi:cadherin-like domain-containing protein [Wenzhouxiangella sp. XN79A]|uniref:Ig-like domain-containing protein n=1 Tax=Wenzhouxiangella sp. XN79A TaxID=2724193 RepID=UPI00144AE915|nr:Ig-like domain-containing protein [Wenzhouxiangella sp. XN79A]NKI33856.1 cadherin-like domain-containing protein [Wenzhouxiangella sp. XN79A]
MRNDCLPPFAATLVALVLVLPMAPLAAASDAVADSGVQATSADGFPEKPDDVSPERWGSLKSAVEQAKLLPSPSGFAGPNGQFGYAVAVDGNRALVGGIGLVGSGAAVVLEGSGGGWVEVAVLRPSDGEQGDEFGWSVSLSGDRALVGARLDADNGISSGSAYVFDFNGISWDETAKLTPGDGAASDQFGFSVSLASDRALVGAFGDDDNGSSSGSAYLFDFNGTSWSETAKLTPADGARSDAFGYSVSLSGDRALVGAPFDDDNGTDSGSAYVFDFDGSSWGETTTLTPADGAAGDQFGRSVSLASDRALVGANLDDGNGSGSGSAYVFDFNGTSWGESATLTPADGAANDEFGFSVSLANDRALVGAPFDADNGSSSGSAYVFDFNGTSWGESAKLTPADGAVGDQFGYSVSLSGDRALVGARLDDDNGSASGSAYVFDFNGTSWSETTRLTLAVGAASDQFGYSVSLAGDRALVGAPFDADNGSSSGSAYVFDFNGTSWSETAKLTPADGAAGDQFGFSVSLASDRALVGAPFDDDNGTDSGSAYVFDFDGSSWGETTRLTPVDGAAADQFGYSVSLANDRALVGAFLDDDNGSGSGSAYVFDFNGTSWGESAKLTPADGAAGDQFGWSVSLASDRALVGARLDADNGSSSGSAYVFDFNGTNWGESAKLTPGDGAAGDQFGFSVSLAGDRALVGTPFDDDNGSSSGSAYVFDFNGTSWGESAKLTPADGAAFDQFGRSVSLASDRALVGTPFDDDNGSSSGSAYVFDFNGTSWGESAKLTPADGAASDQFGFSVSLANDRALVGAYRDDDNGTDSGSAYVFTFNQPPAAQDDAFGALEDQPLSGNVFIDNGSGPDADPDGDSFELQSPGTFAASGIGGSVTTQANGDFSYTPPLNASGVATFGYAIADPSGATATATVTITVLPINDPPTFTAVDPSTVLEDAGAQAVLGWAAFDAGAPNEPQGVLGYTVANVSNPALFAAGPTVAGSGTLSFTPASDAFGTSTFEVTVQDDGGVVNGGVDTSDPQTFTITVQPVNDAPSFASGGNVTEIEDGDYAEPWASAISAGPANESGQTVTFMTTVTANPGLFAVAPSVDPTGTLAFTPVADTTGMATIEVVAMDDGGVANGGVDLSDPVSFTIDVIAAADLTIDKTSGSFFTEPGGAITYSIVVSNPGPSDVTQATVTDTPPARLGNVTWTCTPSGSAACNPSGTVAINELVNLPEGTSVTFTLDAELLDDLNDPITNTASVTAPAGVLELAPTNNSDSDTDLVGLFADGMESEEP